MKNFLKIFFGSTSKDNIYLESEIITSISIIFSGLNSLNVIQIHLDSDEINYSLSFRRDENVKWYYGCTFGNSSEIYNLWFFFNWPIIFFFF